MNRHVIQFPFFLSSKPHCQAEFSYIEITSWLSQSVGYLSAHGTTVEERENLWHQRRMIRVQIQLLAELTALTWKYYHINSLDHDAMRPKKPLNLSGSKVIIIRDLTHRCSYKIRSLRDDIWGHIWSFES